MIVADVTPAAAQETPLIGTYIFSNMVLIIITMAISAAIIWMKNESNVKRVCVVKYSAQTKNLLHYGWT